MPKPKLKPKPKDIRYWKRRLVLRKYADQADARTAGHFSTRVEQDGRGWYFLLGSADKTRAAIRALEIHRYVLAQGLDRACHRYAREFTLAVFWNTNPVLCTYTTLLTSPGQSASDAAPRPGMGSDEMRLVILEADAQIRQALLDWARQLPGSTCVGAPTGPLLPSGGGRRRDADLVLWNRCLPDPRPGLPAARTAAAAPASFAFGIYETSDDIFISHTGVSRGYFLHRTPPAQVLAPITHAWSQAAPGTDPALLQTRDYFLGLITAAPGSRPAGETAALTPREEEILLRLSKGYQDKQIADGLSISAWTVHNHIKNIFKKLRVHTRTQAAIKHLQK